MRKFTYKKGKAVIRTLKEVKLPKKKWNLDRFLYFILLLVLILCLFRFVYKKTVWIYGNGQMLMEKVDVNFTKDIRLKEIFIAEGDTVTMGEELFNYFQDDFDNDAAVVFKNIDHNQKQKRLLEDVAMNLVIKQGELTVLKKRKRILSKQLKNIQKMVVLGVYTRSKLYDFRQELEKVKMQIELLQNEIFWLLQQKKKYLGVSDTFLNTGTDYSSVYNSPIKGVVGQILKNSEESCYKTENVMTIHDTEKVYIKAYFNLKDIAKVKEGAEVEVEFPDKSKSKGTINKLYIATYKAPTEFQKKYEPTERNILAEIIPMYKEEIPAWAKYYKLNLQVKLKKI